MAIVSVWKQNLIAWALNQFTAAQWETLSVVLNMDDLVCLQESMMDCRHRRFVSFKDAFGDLE